MRNDEHSFSEIVRIWQKPLYWYIRRLVGVHEDAEDILQETFAKAFRKLWTLRNPDALRPWLFRIATNEVNRHFRKPRLIPLGDVPPAELPSDDVDDSFVLREAEAKLPAAIARLGLLQREVFCMKYYEDMDYSEICRITGANRNTLMVTYHQAKEKIKKEIL